MRNFTVSDLHVNSHLGLWPPDFVGDNNTPYPQNKFQRWLWEHWLDTCEWAHSVGEFIVTMNGDVLQGINPSKDVQLMVANRADMLKAAQMVVAPLIQGAYDRYVVKGTDWHEGACGQDVETFAFAINAHEDEETGQSSYWSLLHEMDGKLFAFSHHTPVTTVYHATPLQREWREMKEDHVDFGTVIPDCIVHSHVHRFYPYLDKMGRLSFTTAGWQLKNAIAYRNKPFRAPEIGSLMLWVEGGKIQWDKKLYPIPAPKPVLISTTCLPNCNAPEQAGTDSQRTNLPDTTSEASHGLGSRFGNWFRRGKSIVRDGD